jgi:hypothetical protein
MIAKYAATMLAAALMAAMAGVWVSAVQPHRAKAEEQVALTCKVFLTQYPGNTKREAALPYLPLTDDGRRIHIARLDHSKSTWVTVKDGGPWNLRDNYWRGGLARDRFSDLPRCVPEAQAAYQDGYNGGKDQFGRLVTNPAGVDVTPAVARELGLSTNRSAWVYVRFPWVAK